ncbi:hypothetical protein [Burkholderia sp. WSM2230]|uniref:hypothetical protein n=1 Tax=Burkholderia sp. WSM2230 TaxID=944435 RepID=UPI00041FF014|nr:hypothetical protein [Burkholderia sp. WSM2230]
MSHHYPQRRLLGTYEKNSFVALAGAMPSAVYAHAFGATYTLPLPLWLYLYACVAALVASFAVAIVIGQDGRWLGVLFEWQPGNRAPGNQRIARSGPDWLRAAWVAALLVCAASGVVGSQVASANVSMTLFWILFVPGFQYLCAGFGDLYAVINPWRTTAQILRIPQVSHRTTRHADSRGYYVAFAFLYGLICIELFGTGSPRELGIALLAYTLINLLGAFALGSRVWFASFEAFAVLFNIVGSLSVLRPSKRELKIINPIMVPRAHGGVLRAPPTGLMLCILFLLSSTAFDGFRDTRVFVDIYWVHIYRLLTPWVGPDITRSFPLLQSGYHVLQYIALLLSPLPFALVLWLACLCGKAMLRTNISSAVLSHAFSPALIPVAVGYNVAHYFTLVVSQGPDIVRLLSDPLGSGWNLFGTAYHHPSAWMLSADVVWHIQVAAILAGHVVGILFAHRIALQLFGTGKTAAFSQFPTLVVMLLYTTFGLWLLSAPFAGGGMAVVR